MKLKRFILPAVTLLIGASITLAATSLADSPQPSFTSDCTNVYMGSSSGTPMPCDPVTTPMPAATPTAQVQAISTPLPAATTVKSCSN